MRKFALPIQQGERFRAFQHYFSKYFRRHAYKPSPSQMSYLRRFGRNVLKYSESGMFRSLLS
jgi:hypothetical protein